LEAGFTVTDLTDAKEQKSRGHRQNTLTAEYSKMHALVIVAGWYDVPRGMFFSFPVQLRTARQCIVVQDLAISQQLKDKLIRIANVRYISLFFV